MTAAEVDVLRFSGLDLRQSGGFGLLRGCAEREREGVQPNINICRICRGPTYKCNIFIWYAIELTCASS